MTHNSAHTAHKSLLLSELWFSRINNNAGAFARSEPLFVHLPLTGMKADHWPA